MHTKDFTRDWLIKKYFNNDKSIIKKVFRSGAYVLDAGCGASFSAECLLGKWIDEIYYIGVDISDSVYVASNRLREMGYNMTNKLFIKSDLNCIPIKNQVDVVFSEGVLHHTDSTERAIINLANIIKPGGYFLFYVYAKKGPIREFTDDYIRDYFKDKTDEETWKELESLTEFGKYLGELNIKIDIKKDIKCLGISKGEIDLQRFFYWNIFKCFYRSDYSVDEMNHINFDWYRPANCHRQTPEEVREWCIKAGLDIERINVEEAGITVVAKKR